MAAVAIGGMWYLAHNLGEDTNGAMQGVTNAPALANHAALESDVVMLQANVEAVIGEDSGTMPTVSLANGQYVVTGTSGSGTAYPATPGVTGVTLTGTETAHCVGITAGTDAVHITSGGGVENGPC